MCVVSVFLGIVHMPVRVVTSQTFFSHSLSEFLRQDLSQNLSSKDSPVSASPVLGRQIPAAMLAFYTSVRDLNSGSRESASTVLTVPSSQPDQGFLYHPLLPSEPSHNPP